MTFAKEELKSKRIGVLSGGLTTEREPSLVAGSCVTEALRGLGYDVRSIDVGLDVAQRVAAERIEVAFIVLLGGWGEDGTVQGLLESMSIPYTGSGVLASAIAHDKLFSKYVFGANGVPVAPWITVAKGVKVEVSDLPFGLPCVVKPSREGSSVGVHIVRTAEELALAMNDVQRYCGVPIIEKYVDGHEVCVGVVAEKLLGTIEIVPLRKFYDFTAKYTPGNSEYHVPARLSRERTEEIIDITLRAYRAIGCSGTARSDLRVPEVGNAVILEMNPSPGLSNRSLMAKIAAHEGTSYPELCERILRCASLKA